MVIFPRRKEIFIHVGATPRARPVLGRRDRLPERRERTLMFAVVPAAAARARSAVDLRWRPRSGQPVSDNQRRRPSSRPGGKLPLLIYSGGPARPLSLALFLPAAYNCGAAGPDQGSDVDRREHHTTHRRRRPHYELGFWRQ